MFVLFIVRWIHGPGYEVIDKALTNELRSLDFMYTCNNIRYYDVQWMLGEHVRLVQLDFIGPVRFLPPLPAILKVLNKQ